MQNYLQNIGKRNARDSPLVDFAVEFQKYATDGSASKLDQVANEKSRNALVTVQNQRENEQSKTKRLLQYPVEYTEAGIKKNSPSNPSAKEDLLPL